MNKSFIFSLSIILVAMLFITGCGKGEKNTIKVGSKEYTEQLILGQIAVIALKNAGFDVEDKTNITGTDKVRSAILSGDIDLYWEYTGSGWMANLKKDSVITDAEKIYNLVKEEDLKNNIIWLDRAPFNNTYTIILSKATSDSLGIKTISEWGKYIEENKDFNFASIHEFTLRNDGIVALQKKYNFKIPKDSIKIMDQGIIYTTLKNNQIKSGIGNGTDGRIKSYDLISLIDDKKFFPIYNPAITIRKDTLEKNPTIAGILNPIAAALTMEDMIALNYLVDIDEKEPKTVAKNWLKSKGFIK